VRLPIAPAVEPWTFETSRHWLSLSRCGLSKTFRSPPVKSGN
jgi:hypothetical protein